MTNPIVEIMAQAISAADAAEPVAIWENQPVGWQNRCRSVSEQMLTALRAAGCAVGKLAMCKRPAQCIDDEYGPWNCRLCNPWVIEAVESAPLPTTEPDREDGHG